MIVSLDDNHEMLNEGYSNHTPWNTHREYDEDRLLEVLTTQAEQLKDVKNAIFNIHVPPYNSQIDNAPLMDAQLRPVDGGQTLVPVGSTAVRKLIETYQPMLSLHGHIHEAKGSTKIGRTLCINPGSTYGEGFLSGVLINLDKKGVRSFQPVQG
jgi:Icc-related predicted phosphoesterase